MRLPGLVELYNMQHENLRQEEEGTLPTLYIEYYVAL